MSDAPTSSPVVANALTTAHHFVSIKLSTWNYLFWRTQLIPFLHGQNLLGYIDGSLPCLTYATSSEFHAWVQQDQAIMSMFISSLSEEVMSKRKANGFVERHKARLVAKSFNQVVGEDFFDTFSPVVKPTMARLLLSLALSNSCVIRQLDVHNAFLNGHLCEMVYMRQLPGYAGKTYPNHVCLLQRSLYGLKQAPRALFKRLSDYLLSGFRPSKTDVSLLIYSSASSHVYLLVYIGDILFMGSDSSLVSSILHKLASVFKIRDLGAPSFFLGIKTISMPGGCWDK